MAIFQKVLESIREDNEGYVMPVLQDELNLKKNDFKKFIDKMINEFMFRDAKNIIHEQQSLKLLLAIRDSLNKPDHPEYIGAQTLGKYFDDTEQFYETSKFPLKRILIQAIRYSIYQNTLDQEEATNTSPINNVINIKGHLGKGQARANNIDQDDEQIISKKLHIFLTKESQRLLNILIQIRTGDEFKDSHPLKKAVINAAFRLFENYPNNYTAQNLAAYDYASDRFKPGRQETQSTNTLFFSNSSPFDETLNQIEPLLALLKKSNKAFDQNEYKKQYLSAIKSDLLAIANKLTSSFAADQSKLDLLSAATSLLIDPSAATFSRYAGVVIDYTSKQSPFNFKFFKDEMDDFIRDMGTHNHGLQFNVNSTTRLTVKSAAY